MSVIRLSNLSKVYGKNESETIALDNINLEILKGEMVAIIGPSGSGKSTLLNILGCIDKQTAGEYFLDDIDIKEINKNELAKIRNKKIGFIFQNFNLLYDFNLVDNVIVPLSYSSDKKDMKKRAIEMLKKVGLGKHLKKNPKEISGGQKQRVAIARALVNNPEIILADEPTGSLDRGTGEEVMTLLRDINDSGRTVIIITHDNSIANQCNRVINIVDGKIFF